MQKDKSGFARGLRSGISGTPRCAMLSREARIHTSTERAPHFWGMNSQSPQPEKTKAQNPNPELKLGLGFRVSNPSKT